MKNFLKVFTVTANNQKAKGMAKVAERFINLGFWMAIINYFGNVLNGHISIKDIFIETIMLPLNIMILPVKLLNKGVRELTNLLTGNTKITVETAKDESSEE